MTQKKQTEQSKGDSFTQGIPTEIWCEEASSSNPYIAEKAYCHGYDFDEIVEQLSYVGSLYLMLTGRLPTSQQAALLELTMKFFITPGFRHPATRAAMNAGIGRTHVTHILPISLSVLSAEYLGSQEVGNAMQFIKANIETSMDVLLVNLEPQLIADTPNPIPGFGTLYSGKDQLTLKMVDRITNQHTNLTYFNWCKQLVNHLAPKKLSWLPTGLAAALFLDLDINYRTGICLFQMLQSPGLIAHGVEKANKPLTDMPFVSEDNYVIRK